MAALFDEHAGMVLGLCRLLLRDHHEAEDAAQQTFVSAYRSLLRGTEPREPGPWLAAIARNECRGRLRRRMKAPVALDGELEMELADTSDLAELADRRAELAQLATEIAKLPSRQREALALRDFLGLSYEEVASTLKVSVPVVESLLFRARRRLRDTVRTVPRYAAGIVMVPIALRAAVARDVPDFDAITVGLGLAGVAGAAAGGVAKLLSVPASVKVAATVAVVATGSVVAPKLMTPSQEAAPPAVVRTEDRSSSGEASPRGSSAESPHPKRESQTAPEPTSSSEPVVEAAPVAAQTEEPATAAAAAPEPPEADPVRINSGVHGAAPPPPPPPPPTAESSCPVAVEDEPAEETPAAVGEEPVAHEEGLGAVEETPDVDPAEEPACLDGTAEPGAPVEPDPVNVPAEPAPDGETATSPDGSVASTGDPAPALEDTSGGSSGVDGEDEGAPAEGDAGAPEPGAAANS